MFILDILKVLQVALTILLVAAIAMALLMIASYLQEELDELKHNATAMAFLGWFERTIDTLKKTAMTDEFPPLYNVQSYSIDIGFWLEHMAQWRSAIAKPKHKPRHALVTQGGFFEDGFESFARGFDRAGNLLEKRAPRHREGHIGSEKYLKLSSAAYPIG